MIYHSHIQSVLRIFRFLIGVLIKHGLSLYRTPSTTARLHRYGVSLAPIKPKVAGALTSCDLSAVNEGSYQIGLFVPFIL